MYITFITFIVMLFWCYAAYLRKNDSETRDKGAFALPAFFTFKVLVLAVIISALVFTARLLGHFFT
jgi:uncharacterized membrane protein YhdT